MVLHFSRVDSFIHCSAYQQVRSLHTRTTARFSIVVCHIPGSAITSQVFVPIRYKYYLISLMYLLSFFWFCLVFLSLFPLSTIFFYSQILAASNHILTKGESGNISFWLAFLSGYLYYHIPRRLVIQ